MAEWILEHEEDFQSRSAFDAAFWSVETGFHRNEERQYYQAGNLAVRNGALVIEARRETVANAAHRSGVRDWRVSRPQARYTSGSIVSRRALHFGRVEIVARSPVGRGVWPALWLLHESAGRYGEIDFYEAVGKHPDTAFAALHYGRTARSRTHRGGSLYLPGYDGQWHVHAVEWTPERIVASVDGKPILSIDAAEMALPQAEPLRQPMHLRINLALGGTWAGAIDEARLPAQFEIARIRVWRRAQAAAARGGSEPAAPSSAEPPAPPPPPAPAPVPAPDGVRRWAR